MARMLDRIDSPLDLKRLKPEDLPLDFSGSVLDLLLTRGDPGLSNSRCEISAETASPDVAKALGIQRGDAPKGFVETAGIVGSSCEDPTSGLVQHDSRIVGGFTTRLVGHTQGIFHSPEPEEQIGVDQGERLDDPPSALTKVHDPFEHLARNERHAHLHRVVLGRRGWGWYGCGGAGSPGQGDRGNRRRSGGDQLLRISVQALVHVA